MRRLIKWIKCEWEIFCFIESAESVVNNKQYSINKIKEIKNKY